jgi:branched-subunit amino acid transport protein AzlD
MLKKNRIKGKCSVVLLLDRSLKSRFYSDRNRAIWIICSLLALLLFLGIIAAIITPFMLLNQQNESSTTSTTASLITQTIGNISLGTTVITSTGVSCKYGYNDFLVLHIVVKTVYRWKQKLR